MLPDGHGEARAIYMDYQASTPLDPRVLEGMMPFFTDEPGNPHATDHGYGWRAGAAIDDARSCIADYIGADPDEIVFTSGATEANNLAILGAARAASPKRRRIVVGAAEHKCVLATVRALSAEGFDVEVVPVETDGVIRPEAVVDRVDGNTALVSVMAVNNEIGTVQAVGAIAAACHAIGALFHSDGAQALTAVPINVDAWDADLLSLSAHKAYGPKGVGALYIRRAIRSRMRPVMFGGGQEQGLRPGTLPTPQCVGFGIACRILAMEHETEFTRVAGLRDVLLERIIRLHPSIVINGTMTARHPGNLNVRFPGVDADLLLAAVRARLAIASGSACTSGMLEPSHVLSAIGLDSKAATESVRISLGRFTTVEEVTEAADLLAAAATAVVEAIS